MINLYSDTKKSKKDEKYLELVKRYKKTKNINSVKEELNNYICENVINRIVIDTLNNIKESTKDESISIEFIEKEISSNLVTNLKEFGKDDFKNNFLDEDMVNTYHNYANNILISMQDYINVVINGSIFNHEDLWNVDLLQHIFYDETNKRLNISPVWIYNELKKELE